jgi:hypothetical protein
MAVDNHYHDEDSIHIDLHKLRMKDLMNTINHKQDNIVIL